MTDRPLSSTSQFKLVVFFLLLIPAVIFGVGVVPVILIGFGLFMMRRSEDFAHIDTAVRFIKGYIWLAMLGCLFFASYFWADRGSSYWYGEDEFWIFLISSTIAFMYLLLVEFLFYRPLQAHVRWVQANGMFSSKPRIVSKPDEMSVDIIKGERLKSYSVADELLKWAKLKEDGHISEEEFADARRKLLQRN